jgi:hypothetical protein
MTAIVDTNFLVSLTNPREQAHQACVSLVRTVQERLIVPYVVLPEATYLINKYQGHHIMRQFVHRMKQPAWNFEPLQRSDLAVVANILDKYDDQDLDFVDAAIVAIAERLNITRLLTLDRRHFRLIRPAHCTAFELLPHLSV